MKLYRVDFRPVHEEPKFAFVAARNENQARDCIDHNYIFPYARMQKEERFVEDIIKITEVPTNHAGILGYNY